VKNICQIALIILVCVILLAGCGNDTDTANDSTTVGEDSRMFTDVLNREVEIIGTPQRAISLTPAVTEILFELGLGEKVVGVTEFCNYPEAAQGKPAMGDFANPNIELIVAAEPHIVFVAAGVQVEIIERLEQLGITVFCLDAESVHQVIANIRITGEIMGVSEAAQILANEMQDRVDIVVSKVQGQERPVVFFEIWDEPLMTAGPDSFIHNLIELAGGQNLAADTGSRFPQLSMEILFERDPDVYIATDFHVQSDIMARPRYENLTAVRTERVHTIDDDLVTLPGPRIVLGLEEMARIIHPELFQ